MNASPDASSADRTGADDAGIEFIDSPGSPSPASGAAEASRTGDPRANDPRWRKYVDNPALVLISCFFVFAIFGLPLIWMCRKFSPGMKLFWSVVVTLYTALLLGLTGLLLYWVWTQVASVLGY